MIIHDQAKWSLTGNRKLHAANMTSFWPKNWSHSLKNCLQSQTHFDTVKLPSLNKMVICKVVRYRRWSLTKSGHCEQEGILYAHASIWAVEVPQKHFL